MKFRWRKPVRIGPFKFNFTQRGFSSWGLKIGAWSWNSRRGHVVDTPGPGHVEFGRPKGGRG